jgi:hypothetical protein
MGLRRDRKLLWKLDLYLIPWLCLLYLISFLGKFTEQYRHNISMLRRQR